MSSTWRDQWGVSALRIGRDWLLTVRTPWRYVSLHVGEWPIFPDDVRSEPDFDVDPEPRLFDDTRWWS